MNLIIPPGANDAQEEAKPQIPPRQPLNCTMCRWFDPNPQVPIRGMCMFNPPVVHVVGMMPGPLHGQVVPQTTQFVPTVGIDWVCGAGFSPKPGDVQ